MNNEQLGNGQSTIRDEQLSDEQSIGVSGIFGCQTVEQSGKLKHQNEKLTAVMMVHEAVIEQHLNNPSL